MSGKAFLKILHTKTAICVQQRTVGVKLWTFTNVKQERRLN